MINEVYQGSISKSNQKFIFDLVRTSQNHIYLLAITYYIGRYLLLKIHTHNVILYDVFLLQNHKRIIYIIIKY